VPSRIVKLIKSSRDGKVQGRIGKLFKSRNGGKVPSRIVKLFKSSRDGNFTFSKNVQQGFKISCVLTERNFLKVVDKFLRWDSKSLGMC
jgi:hypothetical protein